MKNNILFRIAKVGVLLALSLLFVCANPINTSELATHMDIIDRTNIESLKDKDSLTGETYAGLLVEEIPEYKAAVLDFMLADMYSPDFIQNKFEVRESADLPYTYAEYYSESTGFVIWINMTVFDSAKDAQEAWLRILLEQTSAWDIPPSEANGVVVGDVAYGSEKRITFLRGNIYVAIGSNSSSIVEVALELDSQIIVALEEAARNPERRGTRVIPQSAGLGAISEVCALQNRGDTECLPRMRTARSEILPSPLFGRYLVIGLSFSIVIFSATRSTMSTMSWQ